MHAYNGSPTTVRVKSKQIEWRIRKIKGRAFSRGKKTHFFVFVFSDVIKGQLICGMKHNVSLHEKALCGAPKRWTYRLPLKACANVGLWEKIILCTSDFRLGFAYICIIISTLLSTVIERL